MKRYKGVIFVIVITLLLSSCSNFVNKPNNGSIILETASMLGEGDSAHEPYQKLIADFELLYTNVTVQDQSQVSTEEWKQQIVKRFSEDETTPDVIFYFTGSDAKQLILDEEFVTVEEIQESYPEYAKNIRPSTMNFIKEFDGNHYSVPVKGFWEGLFCNTDLFDKYNLSLPTNWKNLTKAVEVFAESGIIPIAASLGEVPHYWIEHSILAQGGAIEHRLNPSGYVADSWVAGLEQLKKLYNNKAFPSNTLEITNADAVELFADKRAAMILDGSWISGSISDEQNTIVLPMPKTITGKKENTDIISGYSSGYYITRKAWEDPIKREIAAQFVLHMTSDENIAYLCEFGGAPAVDLPPTDSVTPFERSIHLLQSNAKTAIMPIDSRLNKESWKYLCDEIAQIVLDKISPTQVVTQIAQLNKW